MSRILLLGLTLVFGLGLLWAQPKAARPGEASWIWHNEGEPAASAPAETRYFRGIFTVETVPAKSELEITADNRFVVWLNGVRVGDGDGWEQLHRFDLRKHLKVGKNVLAVEGKNDGGPAGLIVRVPGLVVSDKGWKSSVKAEAGWQGIEFNEAGWKAVRVLGPYGKTAPWGGGSVSGPARPRTFQVPEGFKVELAVERPANRGPFSLVNMCFDAKGRLLLSQEGGPILLGVKPDRQGVYQEVVEYCTQVKNSQGMCWVDDALLLVGDGPKGTGLYRCKDTDADDRIDDVQMLHRYQGGMGEHGPHAIIHGPDGWLYLVVGNHAWCQADQLADNSPLTRWPKGGQGPDQGQPGTTEDVLLPRLNDANGHAANIRAPGGTIWRLDHQGKNLSLFSAGYRNQFDAAFTPSGELFSYDSDMEWDEGLPWYRAVRVCHATPGSDFVWRTGAANTPNYYADSLPPLLETGRGSPVGVEVCDHPSYPDRYRGSVFLCDWSIGVIYAVHLKRSGGTYQATSEKFCTGSPLNVTDCAFGPDGSLYFTLGGRGSQGGVYRIVPPPSKSAAKAFSDPAEVEAEAILDQVRQPQSAWGRAELQSLKAKSSVKPAALTAALLKRAETGSARAVMMLHLLGSPPSLADLTRLVGNKDPEVRAAALWSLGVQGFQDGLRVLVNGLSADDALVRRRACEALVRARLEPPLEALLPVLADGDIFVRTAARLVLQRLAPGKIAASLKAMNKRALREGIIALCKVGKAADHAEAIFERLHEGSPGDTVQDLLDHLRTIQLALIHTSKRPGSVRGIGLDCLEMFPHQDSRVNRELAILLAHFRREKILDEPVHARLLDALLKAKDDRPQQIHYFYCLRLLHEGWEKEQKTRLLAWYEQTRDWRGGASFTGFLHNILKDLGPVFSREDRAAVLAQVEQNPQTTLALLRTATVDQLPGVEQLGETFLKIKDAKNLARGTELRQALTEAIGRTGTASPEGRMALRKLADRDPALQDAAALGLARELQAEDWPYVVRGLESSNRQLLFEVIQALKRSQVRPKPEDSKPFRALLLAAPRLEPGNRGQVVELLRLWAGNKRFSPEEKDWAGELAGWSRWFGQTFPKEPALPDVGSDRPSESKWKWTELLSYLEGEGRTGDVKKGRAAFEKGQCLKCHKYGQEGEALGPDLTTLSKRFKRSDTLEALFHPSKVISDQYRSTQLVTRKGQQITGLLAVQGDTLTVLQSDGTKVTLKRGDVEQQLTSLVSVMPERLLDLLTREEIRDLFAFLESTPGK